MMPTTTFARDNVLPGDLIGRRYRLIREAASALPGTTRWLAADERLGRQVHVDLLTVVAPTAVIRAAHPARLVRDRRLVALLGEGFERVGSDRTGYLVSAIPEGVTLAELRSRVELTQEQVSAILGTVAAAMATHAERGIHHGALTADLVWIGNRGSVTVAGLGVAGELAAQATTRKGKGERADAEAIGELLVESLLGRPAADVSRAELPDTLGKAVKALCKAAVTGSGPRTLAEVVDALGKGSPTVLAELGAAHQAAWWPLPKVVHHLPVDAAAVADVDVEALPDTDAVTDVDVEALPDHVAVPDADVEVETEVDADVDIDVDIDVDVDLDEPVTAAPERLKTRFGGAVDDMDEFHDIVADQQVDAHRPVIEILLGDLERRFPASGFLARLAEAARLRSERSRRVNAGPLLVLGLLIAVAFAGMVAYQALTADPPAQDSGPSQEYPEFTFGPSPSPSA